jgi:L-iditol 2-dehydrogenase
MEMMKAAVLLGETHLEIREVPIPRPKQGEILVKVKAATTCGTDVKTYLRGHPKFPPPFIFGHEFGGDVVQLGAAVDTVQIGTRVTANVFAECGSCFYCRKGQGNLCEFLEYNFGSFAEYQIIPASIVRKNLFEIPAHISYAQAAIVEPLVCVVHAQKIVGVKEGETVALIGAGGPISLLHLQMIKRAGAGRVIAIGHSDTRLATAQKLGADVIVNARREDAAAVIEAQTDGRGADVTIECAGTLDAWQNAVQFVRRGGRVLWFGGLPAGTRVPLDAARVHYGEIALLNVHGGTSEDAQEAFDLIVSGEVDTQSLLSTKMPLDNVAEALQLMINGAAIKVEIQPEQ